jgi:hypothetical protein
METIGNKVDQSYRLVELLVIVECKESLILKLVELPLNIKVVRCKFFRSTEDISRVVDSMVHLVGFVLGWLKPDTLKAQLDVKMYYLVGFILLTQLYTLLYI